LLGQWRRHGWPVGWTPGVEREDGWGGWHGHSSLHEAGPKSRGLGTGLRSAVRRVTPPCHLQQQRRRPCTANSLCAAAVLPDPACKARPSISRRPCRTCRRRGRDQMKTRPKMPRRYGGGTCAPCHDPSDLPMLRAAARRSSARATSKPPDTLISGTCRGPCPPPEIVVEGGVASVGVSTSTSN